VSGDIYERGVPGEVFNLNSTSYPDHGNYGDLPLQGKIPTAEPAIEPGTSWLLVRSSDHQATRMVSSINFYVAFFFHFQCSNYEYYNNFIPTVSKDIPIHFYSFFELVFIHDGGNMQQKHVAVLDKDQMYKMCVVVLCGMYKETLDRNISCTVNMIYIK
jgi:hypothetical protein